MQVNKEEGLHVNREGLITFVSHEFVKLMGRSERTFLGRNVKDFIVNNQLKLYFLENIQALWDKVIPSLHFSCEWQVEGRKVYLLLEFSPPHLEGVTSIVSVRKLSDSPASYITQDYLEQIVDNIGASIWLCSLDVRKIYYMSPNFEKFHEMTLQDYLKDPAIFLNRVHPEDLSTIKKLYDVQEGPAIKSFYFRYLLNDGSWRHIDVYRFPIYDEEGKPSSIAGISFDNSTLYKAKENLEEQQLNLKNANESLKKTNQMLEDFTIFACHDLSQPLRAFSAYTQILHKEYLQSVDEEGQFLISSIYSSIQRMIELVQGISYLSLIRKDPVDMTYVNVKDLLEKVIEPLYLTRLRPECRIEKGHLEPLLAREEHLATLFENLIGNSIKYSDNVPYIRIRSKKFKDFTVYALTDNGIGIHEMAHKQIFALGKRLHSMSGRSGSGIGLAACEKIMTLYGGKIWVHSKPNEGATFYLLFPHSLKEKKFDNGKSSA